MSENENPVDSSQEHQDGAAMVINTSGNVTVNAAQPARVARGGVKRGARVKVSLYLDADLAVALAQVKPSVLEAQGFTTSGTAFANVAFRDTFAVFDPKNSQSPFMQKLKAEKP